MLNHFTHVTVFQNSIRNCRWIWVHLREAYLVWCLKCQSLFEFKRKKGWVDTFIENCYCQIPSFRERVFHFNVNNKYGNQTLTKCYFIQCHFAHLLNHFTWIQLFFHCEMFQITKPDHYSLIAPEWSLLPVNNRRMWELEMRWFWISYESERERESEKNHKTFNYLKYYVETSHSKCLGIFSSIANRCNAKSQHVIYILMCNRLFSN